mmetsp:Transcript_32964/g.94740  ORF Transcript_32964/g.94740 Transcript_32964/m.94740 type:complete len:292 (-) Transcript_32964:594-1469(-)
MHLPEVTVALRGLLEDLEALPAHVGLAREARDVLTATNLLQADGAPWTPLPPRRIPVDPGGHAQAPGRLRAHPADLALVVRRADLDPAEAAQEGGAVGRDGVYRLAVGRGAEADRVLVATDVLRESGLEQAPLVEQPAPGQLPDVLQREQCAAALARAAQREAAETQRAADLVRGARSAHGVPTELQEEGGLLLDGAEADDTVGRRPVRLPGAGSSCTQAGGDGCLGLRQGRTPGVLGHFRQRLRAGRSLLRRLLLLPLLVASTATRGGIGRAGTATAAAAAAGTCARRLP